MKNYNYDIGDWIEVIGDYVSAQEWDIKSRQPITQLNWDQQSNPGPMELVKQMGPYWLTRDDDGNYYKLGNKALASGCKLMTESQLKEGWLEKAGLTLGMVLSMFAATAQNSDKIAKVKDTITKQAPTELIQQIQQNKDKVKQDPRFAGWGDEALDKIFDFTPTREFPELDLGAYGGDLHVAKVASKNHKKNGDIEYTVDISDKRYLNSKIFKSIREFNNELNGVEINFTYRGTPLPGKTIKL